LTRRAHERFEVLAPQQHVRDVVLVAPLASACAAASVPALSASKLLSYSARFALPWGLLSYSAAFAIRSAGV